MEKIWTETVLNMLSIMAVVIMINLATPNLQAIASTVDKSDGLEKVQQADLVEISMEQGITVKGGDVIGAIRYYQGTSGIAIEVRGWSTIRTYGTATGHLNREWYASDFPSLASEYDFYNSSFKVSREASKVIYSKL